MRSIIQWFQDRKRAAEAEENAVSITIAERVNRNEYQIVQGYFDPKTENSAEYLSPSELPEDRTE